MMSIDQRKLTLRILDGYLTSFTTWCPSAHVTSEDNTVAFETHDHTE